MRYQIKQRLVVERRRNIQKTKKKTQKNSWFFPTATVVDSVSVDQSRPWTVVETCSCYFDVFETWRKSLLVMVVRYCPCLVACCVWRRNRQQCDNLLQRFSSVLEAPQSALRLSRAEERKRRTLRNIGSSNRQQDAVEVVRLARLGFEKYEDCFFGAIEKTGLS